MGEQVDNEPIEISVRLVRAVRSKGALQLFMAFMAVNVSNFAFHMITSRVLTPASYGALGALLSLMLVLQVPIGALQVAITQQVAAHRTRYPAESIGQIGIRRLMRTMIIISTVGAAFFILVSPVLSNFLHLDSLTPGALLALNMFPLMIGLVPRALFLGTQQFRPVSVALIGGAATRLVLGYLFGRHSPTVEWAVAASVIGELVTTTLLLIPMRKVNQAASSIREALHIRLKDATAAGVAFAGLLLLTGTDTVLARHYLHRDASGVYVAAATAARSALFLSIAVGIIAFPAFALRRGEGPEARRALVQALIAVSGLSFGAATFIAVFPEFYVTLLMGDRYESSAEIVGMLAYGAAGLGVLTLLVYFNLARYSPRAWLPWLGIVVLATAITLVHDSLRAIANVTVGVTASLVALTLVASWRRTRGEMLAEAELHRPPPPALVSELDLTIVVPFFNPGPRFLPSLEHLVAVLRAESTSFEVIAVSDGSTDGSAEALQEMNSDVVRSVVLKRNWGKGEALRVGLSMGKGHYLGFIDADGDIDASIIKPFLALVSAYEPDIILGSKRHPMSKVEYPPLRRVYSWGYQQFIRGLFRLDVRDTQTGIKLIRRDVLAAVLPYMSEQGFAFDLELFVVSRKLGYRKVFEAPVSIGTRFTSTVSSTAVLTMFRDTLGIFYRLRVLRDYDEPDVSLDVYLTPKGAVEIPPTE